MRSNAKLILRALAAAAMLSLAPNWILAPVAAQTLQDRHCTGKSDAPSEQEILGCSEAIKSGNFSGKDLAEAYRSRGAAYYDKGDADHAIAD